MSIDTEALSAYFLLKKNNKRVGCVVLEYCGTVFTFSPSSAHVLPRCMVCLCELPCGDRRLSRGCSVVSKAACEQSVSSKIVAKKRALQENLLVTEIKGQHLLLGAGLPIILQMIQPFF